VYVATLSLVFNSRSGLAQGGWETIGNKVSHQVGASLSSANSYQILIGYAEYNVTMVQSQTWVQALTKFSMKTFPSAPPIADIYAVGGPDDPGYVHKEIGNSFLLKDLCARSEKYAADGKSLARVVVVAHSSGSYVVYELLRQIFITGCATISGKIDFYNLDGGQDIGFGTTISATMRSVFVYAADGEGDESPFAGTMRALYNAYRPTGKVALYKYNVSHTGCDHLDAGNWCLHQALINQVPLDTDGAANPGLDYTNFVPPHVVNGEYLRV